MFNGYNETPLISYEFSQERADKKQENAQKWSYGHEAGVQQAQSHPNSRQPEFWSGKTGFVGLPNVVKCNCSSCYSSSENQSYQCDTSRHRPWLPRTFPVPLNGSNEPCKLPTYQWDGASLNQSSCYPETNAPFVQESGGKQSFYRHYQASRLTEANQPGVITSLKNPEFGKKQKEEASLQNGMRQPTFCNPIYNLAKRTDSRNYCDPNEKYSNAAPFSIDQHMPRIPVVEPYIKAVPSNLSQNRVPSTGYRSVKENVSQSYLDAGYNESRKMCPEPDIGNEKCSESFSAGTLPPGAHLDYSQFNRNLPETEPQKLYLDSARHSDYYSAKNFQDVINRNNQILDNRKDCVITQINQMNLSEQYNVARSKYQEAGKLSCETYYPKDFEKTRTTENHLAENSTCFQRNEDKNENVNIHARLTRPALIFTDPRFADRTQNAFPYQNNPPYRNHGRPEYSYQGYNAQHRFEYPVGFQRNEFGQCRASPQQMQTCEQFVPQQSNGFAYDSPCQQSADKTPQFYGEKTSSFLMDSVSPSLEAIRSEGVNKNGTSKISPLRLLRKKKFINVPHEPSPSPSTLDATPGLDVRKFWSTWAEEEEENVPSTQVVVLDCQNIDPEQAKLLNLYDTDPVRAVQLETGSIVLKNTKEPESLSLEEIAAHGDTPALEPKNDATANSEPMKNQRESNDLEEISSTPSREPESTPATVESVAKGTSPSKSKVLKVGREARGGKKNEVMDKWTEKKFDFLKRAEESKAAEILRHEEEKKKIFETRMSLQQSLNKTEKSEKVTSNSERKFESMSPLDENSQNSSPDDGDGDVSNLPTSEYRRNKFLDYSDKKVIVNGKGRKEKNLSENEGALMATEEVKLERVNSTAPLPSINAKVKDESCFQVDDILQKMSEIHFQGKDVKLENGTRDAIPKKLRGTLKKIKRKKSDHQKEDQRADKVTLETVKFSIQKSHDLKISFKVLNNSKKCSDEELGSKDSVSEGNPLEDPKNSTELITLKYKSIQRDGDRMSESKKSRRRFRRKKNVPHEKTPVLKIKKSRYMPQSERDPLGTYEDEETDGDVLLKKPYSEEYSASDDFHVHETVDSAKIKLTFKRHKANFETQCKLNNDGGDPTGAEPMGEEQEEEEEREREGEALAVATDKYKAVTKRMREDEIFAEAGIESFQNNPDDNFESDAESISKEQALALEEDAKTPTPSQYSYSEEEESCVASTLDVCDSLESDRGIGGKVECPNKSCEVVGNDEANGFLLSKYSDENSKEFTCGEAEKKERNFEEEEIQEISLDFIRSANSPEIETDRKSEKTEGNDVLREGSTFETSKEYFDSESFRNCEIQERPSECDKSRTEDVCEWKETSADGVTCAQVEDSSRETDPREEARPSLAPAVTKEPTAGSSCAIFERLSEILPDTTEENAGSSRSEQETTEDFDLPPISGEPFEDSSHVRLEFPSAFAENPSESAADEEPSESAGDGRQCSSQRECETAEDESFPGDEKSFGCGGMLGLQLSPEEANSEEVGLSPDRIDFEQIKTKAEGVTNEEVEMSIEGTSFEDIQMSPKFISMEGFEMKNERTSVEEVEMCREETFFDVQSDQGRTNHEGVKKVIESAKEVETSPEGTKAGHWSPLREVPVPEDTRTVAGADVRRLKEETICEISGITFEEELSIKDTAPEGSLPSGDDATVIEETNYSPVDVKTEEKDDRTSDVIETGGDLSTETSRNDSIDRLTFECTETESGRAQSERPQSVGDLEDRELEEGEIIDSPDERENSPAKELNPIRTSPPVENKETHRKFEFIKRKIERRNSTEPITSGTERNSGIRTRLKKKLSRLKSCPPEIKIPQKECKESEVALAVAVEDIPLPTGPPPHYSCFDFTKYNGPTRVGSNHTEAKEKPKESISPEPVTAVQKDFNWGAVEARDVQSDRNTVCDANAFPLLNRSTKIKFSISKKSKFSKGNLKIASSSFDVFSQPNIKEAKNEETSAGVGMVKKSETDCEASEDCQSQQVPNASVANGTEEQEIKNDELKEEENHSATPVELLGEDLTESIEVIGALSDYMRDEYYECEDIPTSEDLTNGDDLEMEKVNDDKFRNIMQNCLDNAKKFLNVENLKLFSCSVDDLLELDCPAPEPTLEEPEPPHPNHISRDVLLTSCDDTNDDLGLSENTQPPDLSMDFVPSLCSDVCPEILPVDNWPYLEEEVPSSPTRPRQDESDLIPSVETTSTTFLNSADSHYQFHSKSSLDRRKLISESCFKRFRRRSLMSDGEAIRICSKISSRRRNTVNGFSEVSCEKEIRDIKAEWMRWTKGEDDAEKQSVKCRLSLEKLKDKRGVNVEVKKERVQRISEDSLRAENGIRKKNGKNLDFKSPTWQPKVMLLRISKNELKKVRKESKHRMRLDSKTAEVSSDLEREEMPAVKKPRKESDVGTEHIKLERERGEADSASEKKDKLVGLAGLESIKGSLSVIADESRRKKSRFRNLHTKKKCEAAEDAKSSAQAAPAKDPMSVENALTDMFKDCDRVSDSQGKSTKEGSTIDEKRKNSNACESHTSKDEGKNKQKLREEYKNREKRKEGSHRERRKEEGEQHKHRERRREDEKGRSRHGSGHHHKRSKHSPGFRTTEHSGGSKWRSRGRSRSSSGGDTCKAPGDTNPEDSWFCEVCGFDDAKERVAHIKNHPFHCQSCHLAFKTETYFVSHLTKKHKNIRNQHHCLLCELSFDTEELYQKHLGTREHRHLESVEKNTINTLFTLLTGAPCPVLGLVEMKPEWLPSQAGTVHFYHQATPLSLALQVVPGLSVITRQPSAQLTSLVTHYIFQSSNNATDNSPIDNPTTRNRQSRCARLEFYRKND